EAAPTRMPKVGGPLAGDHSVGARRSRAVEPDGKYLMAAHPGDGQNLLEGVLQCLEGRPRTFLDPARSFDESRNEVAPGDIEDGGVVGAGAVVQADHDPGCCHSWRSNHLAGC